MFIWFGTRTAVRKLGPATGKCHACGSEGRLVNMQVAEQPTLYSFAIGYGIPLAEFLACDACGVQFRSRPLAGHQIGDVAIGSENWACPKCSASNSGAVYKCGACGYSLV